MKQQTLAYSQINISGNNYKYAMTCTDSNNECKNTNNYKRCNRLTFESNVIGRLCITPISSCQLTIHSKSTLKQLCDERQNIEHKDQISPTYYYCHQQDDLRVFDDLIYSIQNFKISNKSYESLRPMKVYRQRSYAETLECREQQYRNKLQRERSKFLWQPFCAIIVSCNYICSRAMLQQLLYIFLIITLLGNRNAFLVLGHPTLALNDASFLSESNLYNASNISFPSSNTLRHANNIGDDSSAGGRTSGSAVAGGGYLDKLDSLERSVAAVLIKVAYGTTSTTKRSIPDNNFVPRLTTIATPLLTTSRYLDKPSHHQQINLHHRNYELDLERDHALPTSAPNADILKSNSNPMYPNPNRHHSHDRDRHRHLVNSTPMPSVSNILKKNNSQSPTIPMYPLSGELPSYSPPVRAFFTPPLPPEYQNPFHDKPILRGTNNEDIIVNTGTYINRRPIPPPSLMPGHERIPIRPPDMAASTGSNGNSSISYTADNNTSTGTIRNSFVPSTPLLTIDFANGIDSQRKKALNTPFRGGETESRNISENKFNLGTRQDTHSIVTTIQQHQPTQNTRKEVLPSIRRILSGSNGNRGEIPEVLLKQVTSGPLGNYHHPPSSPIVLLDGSGILQENDESNGSNVDIESGGNINEIKSGDGTEISDFADLQSKSTKMSTQAVGNSGPISGSSTNNIDDASTSVVGDESFINTKNTTFSDDTATNVLKFNLTTVSSSSTSSGVASTTPHAASAAAEHSTWTIIWYIHVYLSVILFTILSVYSLYKMVTYNKLTHLFSQAYFMSIHIVLLMICGSRIFYMCYDAYNIHGSFHLFISEIFLNLPSTFLTISFSILILFLFRKSLNQKNNRYSALIRPLTVVVGCGVHVILCITLHYVESYTLEQQQHIYMQQQQHLQLQQQQLLRRQQQLLQLQQQQTSHFHSSNGGNVAPTTLHLITVSAPSAPMAPPRVLSLICQIIYTFICLSLGIIYLYLYRILKRVLRSKSQNYIHGYQNLSYAIHITIGTALLFVLMAALQIFGAFSISTTRPLIMHLIAEIDWLQWGYQFSLRLIEVAIITLISWVAGLKTSANSDGNVVENGISDSGGGNGTSHIMSMSNGLISNNVSGGSTRFVGPLMDIGLNCNSHEKHNYHHESNSSSNHVAGFFLPCTSSSSQEQFEADYPAVCQTNTNLQTYTMRTGKLIYDDSFALNSLTNTGGNINSVIKNGSEYQQQCTYQRPYDTGSLHSNITAHHHSQTGEYATAHSSSIGDDHYENPNFDLRGSASASGSGSGTSGNSVLAHTNSSTNMQKFNKTSTTSTTASSSAGSVAGGTQQQQLLLLQSANADSGSTVADSCYSEPIQATGNIPLVTPSSNYDFSNFERPKFTGGTGHLYQQQIQRQHNASSSLDSWSDTTVGQPLMSNAVATCTKRPHNSIVLSTLDRAAYENPERRSSNSTYSCSSSYGGGGGSSNGRFENYNSLDCNAVGNTSFVNARKNGTLNNSIGDNAVGNKLVNINDRPHYQTQQQPQYLQRSTRGLSSTNAGINKVIAATGAGGFSRSSLERGL